MAPYLIPGLSAIPFLLERAVRRLPADKIDIPTGPDRFTPREVVAHQADWEHVFRERMRLAKATPGITTPAYDPGRRAIDHNYAGSDLEEQVRLFAERRRATVADLEGLAPDEWSTPFTHPERGRLTIFDCAIMMLGHDVFHLQQLEEVIGG